MILLLLVMNWKDLIFKNRYSHALRKNALVLYNSHMNSLARSPRGILTRKFSITSRGTVVANGVSTKPGNTEFTRI